MKLGSADGTLVRWAEDDQRWVVAGDEVPADVAALLPGSLGTDAGASAAAPRGLPLTPQSLRGVANSELHWIRGARNLAKQFLPAPAPAFVGSYEAVTRVHDRDRCDGRAADEPLPRWDQVTGRVHVNGELWCEGSTAGGQHSLDSIVAEIARDERLVPGELISLGTLPGCCGLESGRFPQVGDQVTMELDGIGTLANSIE